MLCRTSFVSSFSRTHYFTSFTMKNPLLLILESNCRTVRCSVPNYRTYLCAVPVNYIRAHQLPADRRTYFCSMTVTATSPMRESSASASDMMSKKAKKKALRESPEKQLKFKLDKCSKLGDLVEALRLYDEARSNGVKLNQYHYNVLLYLCSGSGAPDELGRDGANATNLGLNRGFEIFQQMVIDKVDPNEATFTNAARLAIAREDPDMAFDLVKQMKNFDITPKLRSYGPALFGYCKKGMADRAYEVDAHMTEFGVLAEEPELSALLKISVEVGNAAKVYAMLHRLRGTVRQVTEVTAEIIEDWFKSENASKSGEENWDVSKIREAVVSGGGGWHGQGWLGSGEWKAAWTQMDEKGFCHSCGEKLVCIDIDPGETENFAVSLANLVCKKEVKADFIQFQGWLQQHGPFDAVIDGANMGLSNQRSFSFRQLNNVANQVREMSPSKRSPLIILHKSRVTGGPADNANNKRLLETWRKSGALYATPRGSNDDWYWLYAAVNFKCLLVTNDEMRDHLFQLLGTSFFPRWKEKHQVRVSPSPQGLNLHMPPPYSIVIQESENGSWHVPTTTGDDLEEPRRWLCATRPRD